MTGSGQPQRGLTWGDVRTATVRFRAASLMPVTAGHQNLAATAKRDWPDSATRDAHRGRTTRTVRSMPGKAA